MVSVAILYYNIIILWVHWRICGPSLSETSLCVPYLYLSFKETCFLMQSLWTSLFGWRSLIQAHSYSESSKFPSLVPCKFVRTGQWIYQDLRSGVEWYRGLPVNRSFRRKTYWQGVPEHASDIYYACHSSNVWEWGILPWTSVHPRPPTLQEDFHDQPRRKVSTWNGSAELQ